MRQAARQLWPLRSSRFYPRVRPLASLFLIGLSLGAQPDGYQNDVFTVSQLSFSGQTVGLHLFSAVVVNNTDSIRTFGVDIRTEANGLGLSNWQKQFSFPVQPKETRTIRADYEIATPFLKTITVRFGEGPKYYWHKQVQAAVELSAPEALRSLVKPYSLFLSQISSDRVEQIRNSLPALKSKLADDGLRQRLREVFQVAPRRSGGYDRRKEEWPKGFEYEQTALSENGISGEPFSIASSDGLRISAFVAKTADASGEEMPTIFLLTGNPPGTKESQVGAAVFFAKLGYRVVGIDRRFSSRLLDTKAKFLSNFSDPVHDLIRLIDYFSEEYPRSPIGVMGVSAGAAEAQFTAALDPRISTVVLACGIASQNSFFKDDAWVPTYSGMIIFPDLGLGKPMIGKLTHDERNDYLSKLMPEHNAQARKIFSIAFPFFDDMDPMRVAPLIAPTPLLIVTGGEDRQFKPEGAVEVDQAIQEAYSKYGLRAASDLYIGPRTAHAIDPLGGMVIAAFFDRWLKRAERK
jgi:pimeloyl-ACP methyl ester carboxylesterase